MTTYNETDSMRLARVVLAQRGIELRQYIADARANDPATGSPRKGYEDLAYELRRQMDEAGEPMKLVRETLRNWAARYGIKEAEHDYGVQIEDDDVPAAS